MLGLGLGRLQFGSILAQLIFGLISFFAKKNNFGENERSSVQFGSFSI